MKKYVAILIGAVAVASLALILLNRGPGTSPDDQPTPSPRGEVTQPQTIYDDYHGNIWLNAEGLEIEPTPIINKGIVYLPLSALAEQLNVEVGFDDINNIITIGETKTPKENQEGFQIYKNDTRLTPSNIIAINGDFYISYREIAPLLDIYIYESLFENALFMVDDTKAPRDGEYVAVIGRDQRGWAPRLTVLIENGKITSATYNEFNPDGKPKLNDQQYLKNWGGAANIDPLEKIEQLQAQLVENQSVQAIDVTSGATGSYKNFTQLASIIMAQSRVSILDRDYVDGNYEIYGNPTPRGWTPYINMEIRGGEIVSFEYDEVDERGNFKTENGEYLRSWRDAFPDVDPVALAREAMEQLLLTQDPNTIDATTGATSWGRNMKIYGTGVLVQAKQATIADVNFDTVYIFAGELNQRGDRPQLLIAMYNDEKIAVDFSDYRNGVNKKLDEPYISNWIENHPGVEPLNIVQEMENLFLETQDPEALDAITGATSWRRVFKELAEWALELIE